MTWTPEAPLLVGDLRKAMEGLPDDAQMFVDGHPDRPIVGVIQSWQIPDELVGKWEPGDPQVRGLELWLGGDDEVPAPRCKHTTRPKVRVEALAAKLERFAATTIRADDAPLYQAIADELRALLEDGA